MPNDLNLLFQQMGEVLSGVRGLHVTISIRHEQAEQIYSQLRSDLTVLKHDQHELEEKLEFASWISQHEIASLQMSNSENAKSTESLVAAVDALRLPISELVAFKSRAATLLFTAGVLGSIGIWLAEPVYRWLVEAAFNLR